MVGEPKMALQIMNLSLLNIIVIITLIVALIMSTLHYLRFYENFQKLLALEINYSQGLADWDELTEQKIAILKKERK